MARVLVATGEATGDPPASFGASLAELRRATATATAAAARQATAVAAPAAAATTTVPSILGSSPSSSPASFATLFTASPVTKASGVDPTSRQAPGALSADSSCDAANAHATPAINLNDVRSTVGGSDAVMMRLLTKFRERAETTLDGMWRAVEQSDWMTLKRDAHSLKGTSGHVAAVALKATAEALERSANASLQGSGTSPKEALANVEREIDRVLVAIEEATGEPLPLSAPPLGTGLAGASGASAAAVPTYAPALAPAAAPATAPPAAPAPAPLPAPAPAPAPATAPVAPRSAHATPAINLNDAAPH